MASEHQTPGCQCLFPQEFGPQRLPVPISGSTQGDKVCYTPLKDKRDAIRNLESPKTLRQTRAFCGMVNFLSSFLPNLRRLLILIMIYKRKPKSLNGLMKLNKLLTKSKSY